MKPTTTGRWILPGVRTSWRPDNRRSWTLYGWIVFSQGQREQGLDLLRKALEIAPNNPDIAYHLASALSDSG